MSNVANPDAAAYSHIPLSSVSVTQTEIDLVTRELTAGRVSGTGPAVVEFEKRFCAMTNRRHAIAVNSGTSALELALAAVGIGDGDFVIVPGFTFAAPASAVLNAGAIPVLCDVDELTWNISEVSVSEALTPECHAVIAVDVMGNPCDFDRLEAVVEDDVSIIEDAAESLGASLRGRPCGSFGAISIFSFHANKVLTTGEGGIVLTDRDDLAESARLRSNHGMRPGYEHVVPGHNFRISNLAAAFGLGQLARLPELTARREAIERYYASILEDYPVQMQMTAPGGNRSVWLATFRTAHRSGLVAHLRSKSIDARAVWPSLDAQPFLASNTRSLPVSRKLADECFWLPTFHDISDLEVLRVGQALVEFFSSVCQ